MLAEADEASWKRPEILREAAIPPDQEKTSRLNANGLANDARHGCVNGLDDAWRNVGTGLDFILARPIVRVSFQAWHAEPDRRIRVQRRDPLDIEGNLVGGRQVEVVAATHEEEPPVALDVVVFIHVVSILLNRTWFSEVESHQRSKDNAAPAVGRQSSIRRHNCVYEILRKRILGPRIREYVIHAPEVAGAGKPGQFLVIRLHEKGERIPLTIADSDREAGSVTLVVQEVGKSTQEMGDRFHEGDSILDLAGPLGEPTEIEDYGTVVCVGGGVGVAPLYPIARALKDAGNTLIGILGYRSEELVFYYDEFRAVCDEIHVMTDDGSYGEKGFVSDPLREILQSGRSVQRVWAIGPTIMMKVCSEVTREFDIPTIVSLNSVMIDGTGMCGGCRVEVGGVAKFACVDGPEFDGHQVDFDLLMSRQRYYKEEEACSLDRYLTEKGAT